MKLAEALRLANCYRNSTTVATRVFLVCGFSPLHLSTFLAAHLIRRLNEGPVHLETGLFGDPVGSLAKAAESPVDAVAVVVEWADLDPRLGFRGSFRWHPGLLDSILATVTSRLEQLRMGVEQLANKTPVAVALPSLPQPPIFNGQLACGDPVAFAIGERVAAFAATLAGRPMVRVLNPQRLDSRSPLGARYDVTSDLRTGFPYHLEHASVVSELLAELIVPAPPKKGIITDLDNTLWRGILGEDGVGGVSWSLDDHAHGHTLYQEMLASLAQLGVLIGVVSKNDPNLVEEALQRPDLMVPRETLFPIRAGWGPKSEAVGETLRAWNIGADSVVFIDDSPMELAEVAAAVPGIECLRFPGDDPRALLELLEKLRDLYGKPTITEEDRLRASSLRSGELRAAAAARTTPEEFLAQSGAKLTFSWNQPDSRAFDLVNKTNQFNLNGRRLGLSSWEASVADPRRFLLCVSYEDKFGALGKIAVVAGQHRIPSPRIDVWVMSCRAFSRRIEHQTFQALFDRFQVEALELDYVPTERNGPCRDFLESILGAEPMSPTLVSRETFLTRRPKLYAQVSET